MTDLMERLPDPQRIAPVKAAPVSTMCDNWPIAYQTGNSQEAGEDWGIVTDNVRASLFLGLDFPTDAKDDAEFLAYLVNAYRTGQLVPATAQAAEIARLTAERDEAKAAQFITRVERDGAEDHASETADELRQVRIRAEAAEAQVADAYERGVREAVDAMRRGMPGAMLVADTERLCDYVLALIPKPATEG